VSYNTITYIDREDTHYLMSGWEGASKEDQDMLRDKNGKNGKNGTELLNMRAVANAVVKRVHELDVMEQAQTLSTVRLDRGFEVGADYPMHGVIVVGDIGIGRDLETYLNKKFADDPSRFPRSRGWRAVATDSTSKQAFNREHPFFHYRETRRVSQNAARILIVVDRATEGMNNKYLGVMGVAKKARSILEMVQRLGRLVRSAHYMENGKFYVPPVAHDMVHVITHVDYDNEGTIEAALAFMLNMSRALEDMVSIDEYVQFGNDVEDDDPSYKPTLDYEDWMNISDVVGEAIITGKRLSIKKIHNRIPTKKAAKREYILCVAEPVGEPVAAYPSWLYTHRHLYPDPPHGVRKAIIE
jgi:hypothetical protein